MDSDPLSDSAPPRSSATPDGLSVLADPRRPIPDAARLPVVLVHGLLTGPWFLASLRHRIKADRRPAICYSYTSRWRDIPDNAERFARWLNARGPGPYDLVGYSLGAVIIRWAVAHHDLPRIRRVVMIGPPNRGAILADKLHDLLGPFYRLIYGRTGLQLQRGSRGLAENAGQIHAEIGVIAGGTGKPRGYNPWIPGDNDQTVAVEETILGGMKDFVLVSSRHTLMPFSREVAEYTLRFLRSGRFRLPPAEM